MQRAAQLGHRLGVLRIAPPRAQLFPGQREQLGRFVEKDGQDLLIDVVANRRQRVFLRERQKNFVAAANRRHGVFVQVARQRVGMNCGLRFESGGVGGRQRRRLLLVQCRCVCGGLGILGLARGFLAQLVQFRLNQRSLGLVAGRKFLARLDAMHELVQAGDRTRQHRMRVAGQWRTSFGQRKQRLFERSCGDRHHRKATRPVNAAKRVTSPDHFRGRHRARVELQYRKLVLQRAQVLARLVAKNLP